MKLAAKLIGALGVLFVYTCVATTVAQAVGVVQLWADGGLTQTKVERYAAIVYGFDLTKLRIGSRSNNSDPSDETKDEEEQITSRVAADSSIMLRHEALTKGADDIRGLAQQLSTKRERYEIVKQGFAELLTTLEQDANASAIQEVRRTLEILPPKQTKNLLMTMLHNDDPLDEDDVLEDVLGIITGMPQDKLKKVFGEFKSVQEQAVLHQVLVAIGKLDTRLGR